MRGIAGLLSVSVWCAACGMTEVGDDMGSMFGNRAVTYGREIPLLKAGHRQQAFKVTIPDQDSEPLILTLVPPHKSVTTGNKYVITPVANLFAVVQWGTGMGGQAQAEIDVGHGISMPMRGSTVYVEIVNDSPMDVENVGAFLSRGNFTTGQPRRTIAGTLSGVIIDVPHQLPPMATSDAQVIPPFARSLTPSIFASLGAGNAVVQIADIAGNPLTFYVISAGEVINIEIPAAAATITTFNNFALGIGGISYVYDLNI